MEKPVAPQIHPKLALIIMMRLLASAAKEMVAGAGDGEPTRFPAKAAFYFAPDSPVGIFSDTNME